VNDPTLGCLVALPEGWVGWSAEAAPGVAYQAALLSRSDGSDRAQVEASLAIVFQTVAGSNDPSALLEQLAGAGDGVDAELVDLPAGPAVRRSGRRSDGPANGGTPGESFARQYYVPVPGTTDQVAVLSFATSPDREAEMSVVFDRVARAFTFTSA
jgi:hypothetical protein